LANNIFYVKRTSTAGRTPNTTGSYATNSQYIAAGEFALNMADGILYTSTGSAVITVGSNLVNLSVTNNANVANVLSVGNATGSYAFNPISVMTNYGNQNTYVQHVLQNANSGVNASGDLIITNDTGNDSIGYIDLGINSSTYSNAAYNIATAGDGYLYTSNGNLAIGTASAKEIVFHAGGTTSTSRVLTANATSITIANSIALVANGSNGSAGQILSSNGTAVYWASAGAASVNQAAQYNWTNTQSFSNTILFSGQINVGSTFIANTIQITIAGVPLSANGSNGTATQVLTSNGNSGAPYWSTVTGGSGSVNTAQSYSFTNTITFAGPGNTAANSFLTVGANLVMNTTSIVWIGNTTTSPTITLANSGSFTIGNSTTTQTGSIISIANSTGNVQITPTSITTTGLFSINTNSITVGNSTLVTTSNVIVQNASGNSILTPTSLTVGPNAFSSNSTASYFANAVISTIGLAYATHIGFNLP